MTDFDLSSARKIHIVGVGGSGMSAIAEVLAAMGHDVSGSDAAASETLRRVSEAGVRTSVGHTADNVALDCDAVAISTAVKADNPEVMAANAAGVPVLRRAEVLRAIAATRRTVAIAGTHGKTTTSTLTALVLEAGGVNPSYIIGGELLGRGNGAHWDHGAWFVVEADESDGTFLELGAEAVVVTNVEPDHLDHYGGWPQLQAAFTSFVADAPGPKVVCIDDLHATELARRVPVTTYGTSLDADFRIVDVVADRFAMAFKVVSVDDTVEVHLPTAGIHNVRNATAALAIGAALGVPLSVGAIGISRYGGVGRRFQLKGTAGGITFVDEYAHLPGEVKAALAAAKAGNWRRVVAVFQPHRYSRTEQIGRDFGGAFDDADLVVLNGIYAAGESPRPGITGLIVKQAIEEKADHPPLIYVEDRADLASAVRDVLVDGDLCMTIGAGDITGLADELVPQLN